MRSSDSLTGKDLEEVVVTATRTERKLGNIAVPVNLIKQQTIVQSGSLRLNDILQEQTGMVITAGTGSNAVGGGVFGNGIQMQGLSPDHTMILLDGEPLIGRQGGVMDLSRFAVGNIKKIEIVKGPSSSLYGSEAMGGVINIITEPVQGKSTSINARNGSFGTTDLVLSGNHAVRKMGLYYFGNYNSSSGYDLDPATKEKTLDPYFNLTGQIKLLLNLSPQTKLNLSNRFFHANQKSFYAVNSKDINVGGAGITSEYHLNPLLTHQFNSRIQSQLRLTMSRYRFTQSLDLLDNRTSYYRDDFMQGFYRAENQTDIDLNQTLHLTLGGGFTLHTIQTNRYKEPKQQQVFHAFMQSEWKFNPKGVLIGGLRYDHNTDFAARLSPKLALSYNLHPRFKINASAGGGFKAPDFRQLYLNFTNTAGNGYSIFGANEISADELNQQKQAGLIAVVLPEASLIKTLQPEISTGINFGFMFSPAQRIRWEINFFRNDINNLINYIPVGINNNGNSIFSYININRAFTQGLETQGTASFKNWEITAGYQFLLTGDKAILEKIENKKLYGRNSPLGNARLMTLNDYSGLYNRSKHTAQLRLFYQDSKSGWGGSVRLIYRSRFGVQDIDGNGFANMKEEFAEGMLQANATISKKFNKELNIQAGINNLLNQTNARWMPNLPGTHWFISLQLFLSHKTNKQ
ncbi:MAG: TonB-dependent receptor [Bacteroidetes bacterium]|nr:TonB-dependent receptor [Bacteroidota bacterium]